MSQLNLEALALGLKQALPPEQHGVIGEFIALIQRAGSTTTNPDIAPGQAIPAVRSLLAALEGRSVQAADAIVSFGNHGQFGDVTIRDIAGRDITTITIQLPPPDSRPRRAIQSLEYGITLQERLWLEVATLTLRINAFGSKANNIIGSVPNNRRQAITAARALMRSLGDDIRNFTLSLGTIRGEYDDWIWNVERTFQFLFTWTDASLPITKKDLSELGRQVSIAVQKTAELKQAIAGSVNQLRTAVAATTGLEEIQVVLSDCIQELLQFMALIGRQSDFLDRLDVTLDLLLRRA
jgi:hypothetical protein